MLLSKFKNPIVVVISLVSLIIATLTTNIAANVVSPANDFSNISPKHINFVKGGLITAVLGIVMMPWKFFLISVLIFLDGLSVIQVSLDQLQEFLSVIISL